MNKPIYFFYSGSNELLKSKPENVIAIDSTSSQARLVLEDIGMTNSPVPCLYIRSLGRYFDHQNNREYILPESWKYLSLNGVTQWEEVNLLSTKVVEETVVVETVVETVTQPVVEPVVEPVTQPVVEEPVVETVTQPVVEEPVVEPVVQ